VGCDTDIPQVSSVLNDFEYSCY